MNPEVVTIAGSCTAAALALWTIASKIKRNTAQDAAEGGTYKLLTDENRRLSEVVKAQAEAIDELRVQLRMLREQLSDLQSRVNVKERIDELGRNGEIERRGVDRRRPQAISA